MTEYNCILLSSQITIIRNSKPLWCWGERKRRNGEVCFTFFSCTAWSGLTGTGHLRLCVLKCVYPRNGVVIKYMNTRAVLMRVSLAFLKGLAAHTVTVKVVCVGMWHDGSI